MEMRRRRNVDKFNPTSIHWDEPWRTINAEIISRIRLDIKTIDKGCGEAQKSDQDERKNRRHGFRKRPYWLIGKYCDLLTMNTRGTLSSQYAIDNNNNTVCVCVYAVLLTSALFHTQRSSVTICHMFARTHIQPNTTRQFLNTKR